MVELVQELPHPVAVLMVRAIPGIQEPLAPGEPVLVRLARVLALVR